MIHSRFHFPACIACFFTTAAMADPVLKVDASQVTAHIAPTFYGQMTEEINHWFFPRHKYSIA